MGMRKRWSRSEATERGRVFLEASVGEISVKEACGKLGITRQRFYELEDRAIGSFLEALAPKPPGRPGKGKDPTQEFRKEIETLKKENQKLWLYVKVLRKLAGIEDRGKKGRRFKADVGGGSEADDS